MSGKVPVTFNFSDATAKSVHVAGEFNNWLDNVDGKVTEHAEWQLQNDGAGNWKTTVPLASGRYKFKYVIDGGDHWEQDRSLPSTPDGNSVVEVKATGEQPSASAPATPAQGGVSATFTYVDTNANAVFVAGEFNKWNATANPLQKDTNGIWTTSITLPPGRYQYKYVADGNWKEDPANTESADDGLGGRNSVKVVGQ
jgi:1,4-alpha-glucan branching enzyme